MLRQPTLDLLHELRLAGQVPVEHRHDVVGDPTFGDAILDRLLNNAHRITLKGASIRRLYDSTKTGDNR